MIASETSRQSNAVRLPFRYVAASIIRVETPGGLLIHQAPSGLIPQKQYTSYSDFFFRHYDAAKICAMVFNNFFWGCGFVCFLDRLCESCFFFIMQMSSRASC